MTPLKRQKYMDRRGVRVIRLGNREPLTTNEVNRAISKGDGTTPSGMEARDTGISVLVKIHRTVLPNAVSLTVCICV